MNKLLLQKLAVAFLVSFVGALVTSWEGLSKEPGFSLSHSVLISMIVGALGIGVRAVLAFGPLNLVPSDAEHKIVLSKPAAPPTPPPPPSPTVGP